MKKLRHRKVKNLLEITQLVNTGRRMKLGSLTPYKKGNFRKNLGSILEPATS